MAEAEKHSDETSSSDSRTTLQLNEDQLLEDLELETMPNPPVKLKRANAILLKSENQINETLETFTCLGHESHVQGNRKHSTAHASNKLAQVKNETGEENVTQKQETKELKFVACWFSYLFFVNSK